MSFNLFLPFSVLMIAPVPTAACNIDMVQRDGSVAVVATLDPDSIGVLTYRVSATVANSGNRSQSINGGEIDLPAGSGNLKIWQGTFSDSAGTRISISLTARLNDEEFTCEAQFP